MKDPVAEYKKYEEKMQRAGLFRVLAENHPIESALYLGSYIHISPSFYIRNVVYVDSDRKAIKFFGNPKFDELIIKGVVNRHKKYDGKPILKFFAQNYQQNIPVSEESFDLLISQYAGFVSQDGKKYLKKGGILVANNSHGDAGVANADGVFELIAVVNYRNRKFYYSTKKLEEYFIPKKEGVDISMDYLKSLNRGLGYKKTANHYIFRKLG